MNVASKGNSRPSSKSQANAARLEASRLGAGAVKAAFGAVLTRRRFAELVGISLTTVRRWEVAGIVQPVRQEILGSPTLVFDPADVDFGRRLITLLRRQPGELSLSEAAAVVRRRDAA